jgi:molecular chaperone GrpE
MGKSQQDADAAENIGNGKADAASVSEKERAQGTEDICSDASAQASLDEVETLRQQLRDSEDRLLRMAAEFENVKKRLLREYETTLKYAEEGLIKELLPSIDNLERAIEQGRSSGEIGTLIEGVDMTCKGLMATLEKIGLLSVDGVGTPFDPNFHEAIAMEESNEYPPNTILQEYQKGYLFKARLIRAAKVVVSKGAS